MSVHRICGSQYERIWGPCRYPHSGIRGEWIVVGVHCIIFISFSLSVLKPSHPAPGYVSSIHGCQSKAQINWEGCNRKGIQHKIWGSFDSFIFTNRMRYLPLYLLACQLVVIWSLVMCGEWQLVTCGLTEIQNGICLFSSDMVPARPGLTWGAFSSGAFWDRSRFSGTFLNWTFCSSESAVIFWDRIKRSIQAALVTWHVVRLQDGSIHVVSVPCGKCRIKNISFAVKFWYQKY